ncbi:hypothetical protein N7493_008236 [Penicillium malachiteum]|uniref:SNF2 family helicase n=1 Tax=Penicillium malachiteum TaxID=1324776 RepID=A0AAD6HGT5_9EURO|nr:hypothetical protein N7493_008236 [Penicillium malachiteum]
MPGVSRKRKSEIDLTEESDETRPAKTTRDATYLHPDVISTGQRFGENTKFVPLTQVPDADEDDADAANIAEDNEDTDESVSRMLYGTLDTKIVGCRFYNGIATPGEHVILRREPRNQYDRNAIRVDNIMGAQIGHIGRNIAAKLAPYMDSRELVVEGVLTGVKSFYDCPVALPLYGTSHPAEKLSLKQKMQKDRLPIREYLDAERLERKRAKEIEAQRKQAQIQARAMALKRAAAGADWQANDEAQFANLSTPTGMVEAQTSLEELLEQSSFFNPREIGKVVESFGKKESDMAKMPIAETPAGMKTELLHYQKQGLAWMISRESPTLPPPGSDDVVQLWKNSGGKKYTNIATNFVTSTAPTLASGGILADDMGLGKTIQIISLILANPAPITPDSSKATLILAPVGVMSNWNYQIQQHCETAPRVLIYHGSGKKEAANLSDYDVVITSYGALSSEYQANSKTTPQKGLFSLHWRRVILDEGHVIRNPASKGSLAASSLRADSRWTLTGTPIINTLKDLYSQVRFLKLTGGLEDLGMFNCVLVRPLNCGNPEARLLLEALMGTICLRRRKDMDFINLRLPKLTSRVLKIKFHDHEREKYSAFQSEAKGTLLSFKDKQGSASYSNLLEVLLRLRQTCNHWALCKKRVDALMKLLDENKVVPLSPENMKALQDMLQLQIENQEVCAVCLDNFDEPVITACAHSFCKGCIEQVISRQHKCPLCRADLDENTKLVPPAEESGEDEEKVEADPDSPSSKIEALVKVLTAQGQAPGTKTVVFSQWTSFLDLVEPHLAKCGINFARVDGKMNAIKRDNSINLFSTQPECTVLLASLSVCSVGLNLVAANQAILADSWWAPAIEDQAVDRVYRLGQTRETTVWRLIMEGSIEQRVLDIQGRKRELMQAAFRETGRKKNEDRATRLADLEMLLS